MQGGVIGGICLLTFLLSVGRAEEVEGLNELEDPKEDLREIKEKVDVKQSSESKAPDDLKSEISLAVTESNSQENERSGAMAHSSAHSFGGSSISNAVAQSNGGGSSSAYSDGFGGAAQSKATAIAGGDQDSPISPFGPELNPYIRPGSSLSQAEAQAISDSGSSYGQGLNSYPYFSSYPYSSGSSSAQAQADANNEYYQPAPIPTSNLSPYNQASSSAQAQALAENGYYQPSGSATSISSPYNQGSSSAQAQTVAENGYYQPSGSATPILSPYNQGSSSAQAQTVAENGYYQPSGVATPILSPYNQGSSSAQAQKVAENGYYQPSGGATPILSPYNQGSSSTQAQTVAENGYYQPSGVATPILSPYNQGSSSAQAQKVAENGYYQPSGGATPILSPYNQGSSSAQVQTLAENAYYQPSGGATPILSPYNQGSSSAQAQTVAENGLYQPVFTNSPNLSPYNQGSSSAQAQTLAENGYYQPVFTNSPNLSPYNQGSSSAQAQTVAENGLYQPVFTNSPNLSPYNQGSSSAQAQTLAENGYYQPSGGAIPVSSPYNQGSSSAQAQTVAGNGYYQPSGGTTPIFSPDNQASSSAQAQTVAENGLYQPGFINSPNLSPYKQGSSSAQVQAQADSESYQPIIEPVSILPNPASRFNSESDSLSAFSPSYPYSQGSSSAQARQSANGLYQSIPIPDRRFSPYERFLLPYNEPSSTQEQTKSEAYQPIRIPRLAPDFSSSYPYSGVRFNSAKSEAQAESEPYQPIPIPDPNPAPYDSFLVPYRGPNSAEVQSNNEAYQPFPFPNPNPKPYEPIPRPHSGGSTSRHGLRINSAQAEAESEAYQPIPIPDPNPSPYESFMVPYRAPYSAQAKAQDESDEYQPIPIPYDPKTNIPYSSNVVRSGAFNPDLDDDIDPDLQSKSGWNLYEDNPYGSPSGPNPQLYPSGAAAAQAYADVRPGASGVVNPYSQGISPYANDYPSESPYRPAGYNQAGNEAQGLPNFFGSGQSSPIAFEDAKSRIIFPNEYVFPNKMRGGENTIQCSKENEFHHFWSRGLDCLVCICLNEYGLLTPVCASCGGCHKPSPRLPEPIAVQPASPEPFTIIPEPYPFVPQPEPNPLEPIPEPYQPPRPEPHPLYPEPIPAPSPGPVPFPAPIPTLPPVPAEATCNPLPNGTPFTNPLHPCQICVCRESYMSGKPDVQIQCKENPQCIVPDDVTTLPPLPDVPMPIPLPMCEKFPEHVLFPHPTDGCRLCKCSKSLSESGLIEQQITCYPHPDCVAKPEAISGPEPVEPLREPFGQMKPVPLPEIVTVEPLSWPPITTIAPVPTLLLTPRPGPLPGPSPHESCRPYPPNQPFQHPWDDCQICLCAEAYAIGMVTVEVNCYTKPSCCIEPPESLKPAIAGFNQQYPGFSNAVNGPDIQSISSGLAPRILITSTYRPPTIYPSYNSRPVNIYPGNNQVIGAEVPIQPQGYPPAQYPRLQTDDAFANANAASSYNYQPNYNPGYVRQQYPEYPPRLPAPTNTGGSYKQKNYGYTGNYQYEQGDAMESGYPGPRGHFQPYAPRYQGVPSPNAYPPQYQRPNYEMPPMYYTPRQVRDNYALAQASAQGGSNGLSLASAQGYAIETRGRTKIGNDGPEDIDSLQ